MKMNLLDIRKHFRTLSGRYDLVDDDVSGTTNFLINEACKYLDRATEMQKTWAVHFVEAPVDSFRVAIPYCRAIKEVWLATSTERWQLEKKNIQDLIVAYLASAPTSGKPIHYSPTLTRRIPEQVNIGTFAAYMNYMDTSTSLGQNYNAIVILPPTNVKLLVEVRGFFYSKELVLDTDQNYWTAIHPLTLLKASMRELDIFNQNQGKTKLWNEALDVEISNINKDLVEELIAEVDQIEAGSEGEIS
jgi:hypothetical protein